MFLGWLALFELLAAAAGWRGLSWGPLAGWARLPLVAPIILAVAALRRRPLGGLAALLLTCGPALAAQLLLSLWRNRTLDPTHGLAPGSARRGVEQLQLPADTGYLPAIHVVPAGGARAAVAVIHGSGSNKLSYSWRLVDSLIARGLAVLLIDIDGHGENPRPQSWPDITQNAEIAVSWLRARYPRVALVGYSLGGCIAAHAVAHGLAVDALAINESPPQLNFDQLAVRREGLRLLRPDFWHVLADSSLYHFVRAWGPVNIRATISTWELVQHLDLLGSLPRIAAPLLLVYGAADAIVPPAQAEQVRAAMPPQASFHLVPSASHLTQILDPQALALQAAWLEHQLLA
jgi:pimeloyl-ACP methyl ester carboxylesterase